MLSAEEMAINRLECGNTAHSKNADYIQLAIKALKKQVPIKPIKNNYDYICRACGSSIMTQTGDSFIDYPLCYCENCGQKQDWSE